LKITITLGLKAETSCCCYASLLVNAMLVLEAKLGFWVIHQQILVANLVLMKDHQDLQNCDKNLCSFCMVLTQIRIEMPFKQTIN
jgi:hypothetical protein